jgi:hypothetical protein
MLEGRHFRLITDPSSRSPRGLALTMRLHYHQRCLMFAEILVWPRWKLNLR